MKALVLLLILCFVALSAFFSSAEIAFAKVNTIRVKKQSSNGDKKAKKVQYINENFTRSISTLLLGNNFVNIAASSASTVYFVWILGKAKGPAVAAAVITVVLLVFGEILPKILASAIPDRLARAYAPPLKIALTLFFPFVFLVEKFVGLIEPLWRPAETPPLVTPEELREIVDDIEDEGVFTEGEGDLIKSAIEFTDTTAMDILIPRVDVFAIDIEDKNPEITNEFYRYSRIPVYAGSIDNIVGVLPTKKLLRELASGKAYSLDSLIYPPIFVHMTKTVSSIIEEFRDKRQQMAIVVDEYGGTAGILTMEDITEEIVGNIFDERDNVIDEIIKTGENSYLVGGGTNIYDVFEEIGWEPQSFETEYTTIGGWATEMLDKFPDPGDTFEFQRIKVTVSKARSMRVEEVLVEYSPAEEKD